MKHVLNHVQNQEVPSQGMERIQERMGIENDIDRIAEELHERVEHQRKEADRGPRRGSDRQGAFYGTEGTVREGPFPGRTVKTQLGGCAFRGRKHLGC